MEGNSLPLFVAEKRIILELLELLISLASANFLRRKLAFSVSTVTKSIIFVDEGLRSLEPVGRIFTCISYFPGIDGLGTVQVDDFSHCSNLNF